jgi:hypothetical protein
MEQAHAWSSYPGADQADTKRTSLGSRRILTRLVTVILLIVIALIGWRFASRSKGHFAATGPVLSVNPSTGTFSVQPARPAPEPGGSGLPHPTSNRTTSVRISPSTVFQICRDDPAPAEATSRRCSPASFAAIKVGEHVDVVGAVSNNTVTATRVQVL